jgi:hypothetical protein
MPQSTVDKLVQAYHRMMERVRQTAEDAESRALPTIRHSIEKARDTAVELEELTHDEAEKVAYYVKRDVQDAGKHLSESGHELADWLRFDIDRIEARMAGAAGRAGPGPAVPCRRSHRSRQPLLHRLQRGRALSPCCADSGVPRVRQHHLQALAAGGGRLNALLFSASPILCMVFS